VVQIFASRDTFGRAMPYRRTEKVARRLAARHDAILAAARAMAGEAGLGAVQVAPVARRAGIAAGTVYRYFPSKTELIAALLDELRARECAALREAAAAAPGPLSALAAAVVTFAARALANRRLILAATMAPAQAVAKGDHVKLRRSLAAAFRELVGAAIAAGHIPAQDTELAAAALLGLLLEGLVGSLAPQTNEREAVQSTALLALRALGVADARARGLVVGSGIRNSGIRDQIPDT